MQNRVANYTVGSYYRPEDPEPIPVGEPIPAPQVINAEPEDEEHKE